MEIIKATRKIKCAGSSECENVGEYVVHFGKKRVHLCRECIRMLNNECARMVAPRSIKSKFNNIKGRKL